MEHTDLIMSCQSKATQMLRQWTTTIPNDRFYVTADSWHRGASNGRIDSRYVPAILRTQVVFSVAWSTKSERDGEREREGGREKRKEREKKDRGREEEGERERERERERVKAGRREEQDGTDGRLSQK